MTLLESVQNDDIAAVENGMFTFEELNAFGLDGLTPLMYAASKGNHKMCLLLKELGADVDLKDKTGRMAVDHAAKNGHGMVLIMLIEGGCGG